MCLEKPYRKNFSRLLKSRESISQEFNGFLRGRALDFYRLDFDIF